MGRGLCLGAGVLALSFLGGCAARYKASADTEGLTIVAEKRKDVDRFRRNELLSLADAKEKGTRPPPEVPKDIPKVLTLQDALHIATKYSRRYKTQREGLFLQALSLGLTRRNFLRPVFSGSLSYSATDPRHGVNTDSTTASVGVTQRLPTGGTLSSSVSGSVSNSSGVTERDFSTSTSGSVSITQSLLRGAPRWIAFEGLTQAERSLLYAARSFELFRQTFAIDIMTRFWALVSQRQALQNQRLRVKGQEFQYNLSRALYRTSRGSRVDVFRAEQGLISAQDSLLDAEQRYRTSLDQFKIELGLPIETTIELAEELPPLVEFDIDYASAIAAALHNNLDHLTRRDQLDDTRRALKIARNNLLPSLDLSLSYSTGSNVGNSFPALSFQSDTLSLGLTLEIPLDRKAERNAYRSALISMDQALRGFQQAEDNLILSVRTAVRNLRRQRTQIRLAKANIKSIERQVVQAEINNRAGGASNRDVVEARESLTDARNSLLGQYVTYETQRLNLFQLLGLLFVTGEGEVDRDRLPTPPEAAGEEEASGGGESADNEDQPEDKR